MHRFGLTGECGVSKVIREVMCHLALVVAGTRTEGVVGGPPALVAALIHFNSAFIPLFLATACKPPASFL
jgi:hypothetical protein